MTGQGSRAKKLHGGTGPRDQLETFPQTRGKLWGGESFREPSVASDRKHHGKRPQASDRKRVASDSATAHHAWPCLLVSTFLMMKKDAFHACINMLAGTVLESWLEYQHIYDEMCIFYDYT